MSDTLYYLSSCSPHSETAAANPMRAYSKEDCAEIIAHEGGTAYVLASDYEAVTRERDEARAEMQSHIDHLWGVVNKRELERDALRAEVERLRAALSLYRFDKDITGQYGAEAALQEPTP